MLFLLKINSKYTYYKYFYYFCRDFRIENV